MKMVEVGTKASTQRVARAKGTVLMAPATVRRIRRGEVEKGDVLAAARLAGVMAVKRTPDLVPLCHPILISGAEVKLAVRAAAIDIEARVTSTGPTGVEMEALTAVCAAGLTIYDMLKGVDRGMRLQNVRLVHKSGGKSGVFEQP